MAQGRIDNLSAAVLPTTASAGPSKRLPSWDMRRRGSLIEPVDVWGGFRAGRKALPHSRGHGRSGSWLWSAGSHDGYQSIDAQHFRWLGLCLSPSHQPVLVFRWNHHLPALALAWLVASRTRPSPSMSELGLQWHFWPMPEPWQQQVANGYLAADLASDNVVQF